MGRPRRHLHATVEETCRPPATLEAGHVIAQVDKAAGKNLFSAKLPSGDKSLLVEMPSRFRSLIWIKRGSFVVVNMLAFDDRDNKLDGEIVNVIREERQWRKRAYWPKEFEKKQSYSANDDDDDEESNMGKMPSSEESDSG